MHIPNLVAKVPSGRFVLTMTLVLVLQGSARVAAGSGGPLSIAVTPPSANVQANGGNQNFTATVQNDKQNGGVTWSLAGTGCSGATCGSLSSAASGSGVPITYTAPANVPSPATVTLTATSVSSKSKTFTATITVIPGGMQGISVTISPKRGGLAVSQTLSLIATTNDPLGVQWSASGGGFSSASSMSGLAVTFTAPASAGVYTLTATSKTQVDISTTITIGVTDLAGVYTYHNDLSRDGVNTQEYALTPALVNTSSFGKLFSCTADGAIYAQPLWVANVGIGGSTHNVIVAATMRDSVYAFDADASPCVTYWQKTLIPSGETYGNDADVNNQIVQTLTVTGGTFSTPAFWQNTLFHFGSNTGGKAYALDSGTSTFNASWTSQTSASFNFPGATPSVSSSGSSNGIVWVIDSSNYGTRGHKRLSAGPAGLYAFAANNLGTELWNSGTVAGDVAGNAVKFTVPTIANGKVYIGTRGNDDTVGGGTVFGTIDVYGLKSN
jgi:hypothetical protein